MSSSTSSSHYYRKNMRLTAFILLFFQIFFPISISFSAVARASERTEANISTDDMINTMSGIRSLMEDSSSSGSPSPQSVPPARHGSLPEQDISGKLLPEKQDNSVHQDDILSALPTLGLKDSPTENTEMRVAGGGITSRAIIII